jgi:S1-C subfamily serine protease
MKYIAGCVLSSVLGCLMTLWWVDGGGTDFVVAQERGSRRGPDFPLAQPAPPPERTPHQRILEQASSPDEGINVAVYESTNRSVVNITTKATRNNGLFMLEVPSEGTGSGSVLDRSGHILTNYHVIDGAREVTVTLFDGNSYEATLVGADPVGDIAVIKIDAPADSLFPVAFGDSNRLQVGMRVFAIGNPFGLERTMTTGIISSLNRSLQVHSDRTIRSIIQIDAAINPGNSGGPLLDARGRLIGVNIAIASRTGQSSGVGFAIPVNLVKRVVPELIQHGRVIRPDIGIRVYETDRGLLITRLTPGGPGENAGLRGPRITRSRRGPFIIERIDRSAADLIVAVDGEEVKTNDEFLGAVESNRPGDTVELTIIREGRTLNVPVILGGDALDRAPANRGRE